MVCKECCQQCTTYNNPNADYYGDCKLDTPCDMCPSGRQSLPGSMSLDDCKFPENCKPGFTATYSTNAEYMHLYCTACVAGKYKDLPGSQPCTDCPAGKTTWVAFPEAYDGGRTWGSTSLSDCILTCAAGKYVSSDDPDNCQACDSGKYKVTFGTTTEACQNCAAGEYSETAASVSRTSSRK